MTSLIKTISTNFQHLWADIQQASKVASWIDEFLAEKFPQTAPICMASARLGTVAVMGAGTEVEKIVERLSAESRAVLIEEPKIELPSPNPNLTPVYEEIVRRATPKERKALETKLSSLPKIEETIKSLLSALEKGDWDDEIFKNKDFSYYALEAVRRGQLSQNDYGTVQIFWEITQMHPDASSRKKVPIFHPDGTVNEEAKTLILKTLKHDITDKNQPCLLSPHQIDQLFKKIKELPKVQQQIWVVPHVNEPIIEGIFTPILAELGWFDMMVAPMGVMQAFLDTAFGENAVKINPVHGLSTWKDIRQSHLDGKRDYAIHSPLIELPENADGKKARWFYFGKHDFYHALLVSSVPMVYRKFFVECYDIIQRLLKTADPDKGSGIIDMEVIHFFDNFSFKKESPEDVFWVQLADLINATAVKEQFYKLFKEPNFTFPTPEQLSQITVEAESEKMFYVNQLVSHLPPLPEIQEGARAIYQKVKDNQYSYPFDQLKILEALASISK